MNEYARLSTTELLRMLQALEMSARDAPREQLQRLVHDLQKSQIALELREREMAQLRDALAQAQSRYADLFGTSPIGNVAINEQGFVQEINASACRLLGASPETLIGASFASRVDRGHQRLYRDHLRRCHEAGGARVVQLRLMRKQGDALFVELQCQPLAGGFRLALQDIGERKQVSERLRLMHTALEHCEEAVAVCDNRHFILSVNRAAIRVTGFSETEMLGKNAVAIGAAAPAGADRTHAPWHGETNGRRKNGAVYPMRLTVVPVHNESGYVTHYIHLFRDLTQPTSAHDPAHYDALTKLPNAALLRDRLAHALAAAQRNGTEVAVLYLNVDRVNAVNESLGFLAGDRFLQMAAATLDGCLRANDTVCRYESDEFVVVLPEIRNKRQLMHAVEKILRALHQTRTLGGMDFTMGASIGIALYPHDGNDGDTLIKHARIAMRDAKRRGRNTYRFFTGSLGADASQSLAFENELRQALERGQLTLDYQPQVAPTMNRVVGCEALLRWQHPERGVLGAEQIIPAAEECGLMDALGEWTLGAVCAQIRSWHDAGVTVVPVAVNLTGAQVSRANFANMVGGLLGKTEVKPNYLAVELTQRSLPPENGAAEANLRQLKNMGLQIVLDNFGGDYSSLGQLKRFPLSKLKIDKSLVQELPDGQQGRKLVRTIVDIGYNFGFTVAASGVETRAQFECLSVEGCESMQGYYFGPPMAAQEFTQILKSGGVVAPR